MATTSTYKNQDLYGKKQSKMCDEDKLMMYLAEIQAINPENIINLSTLEELSALCTKVSNNLNRMDSYLKTCEPPQQKDLYMQLIKGVRALHAKLCDDGEFRKNFQQHYVCFHDLQNDFIDCSGPADWTEDSDNSKICNIYRAIADCYYVKAAKLCGTEAANIMKELILAVIGSIITVKCNNVKENPIVSDAMPVEMTPKVSSHAEVILNCLVLLLIPILFFNR